MTRSPTAVPCWGCGGEGTIAGTWVTCEVCQRTGFVEPIADDDEPTQPMKRPSFVEGLARSVSETRIAVDARCEAIRKRASR